jgi:hypothetical protein
MENIARDIWESTLGRVAVLCTALGAAPFILLTKAAAALAN